MPEFFQDKIKQYFECAAAERNRFLQVGVRFSLPQRNTSWNSSIINRHENHSHISVGRCSGGCIGGRHPCRHRGGGDALKRKIKRKGEIP